MIAFNYCHTRVDVLSIAQISNSIAVIVILMVENQLGYMQLRYIITIIILNYLHCKIKRGSIQFQTFDDVNMNPTNENKDYLSRKLIAIFYYYSTRLLAS